MTFKEAKQEAILKTASGIPYGVVMISSKDKTFSPLPWAEIIGNDLFPHYAAHHALPSKVVTFVIAAYNEEERLPDTIKDIYRTCKRKEFNIIIVQDGSTDMLKNPYRKTHPEITMVWNKERRGVGFSLDRGVKLATTEQVFIMGSDIRFDKPGWMIPFVERIKANPKSLICTRVAQLGPKKQKIVDGMPNYRGATCLYKNPKSKLKFRSMLEAKWQKPEATEGLAEVGCILGAFYGVNKTWYTHIRGFAGHKQWGTLEPLISLRSWLLGGNCLVDLDTLVGHIFLTVGSSKEIRLLIYNKMLTADLLPPKLRDEVRVWVNGLGADGSLAQIIYKQNETQITELRNYFAGLLPKHHSTYKKRLRQAGIDTA